MDGLLGQRPPLGDLDVQEDHPFLQADLHFPQRPLVRLDPQQFPMQLKALTLPLHPLQGPLPPLQMGLFKAKM